MLYNYCLICGGSQNYYSLLTIGTGGLLRFFWTITGYIDHRLERLKRDTLYMDKGIRTDDGVRSSMQNDLKKKDLINNCSWDIGPIGNIPSSNSISVESNQLIGLTHELCLLVICLIEIDYTPVALMLHSFLFDILGTKNTFNIYYLGI